MRRCQWTGIRLLLSSVRQAHDYAEGHAEKAVYAKRYAIVACAHMRVARQRFLGKPPAAKVYSTPTLLLHAA